MVDICRECKYYDRYDKSSGNCRRFPPPQFDKIDGVPWGAWPVVNHKDWCGEHDSKKTIAERIVELEKEIVEEIDVLEVNEDNNVVS